MCGQPKKFETFFRAIEFFTTARISLSYIHIYMYIKVNHYIIVVILYVSYLNCNCHKYSRTSLLSLIVLEIFFGAVDRLSKRYMRFDNYI